MRPFDPALIGASGSIRRAVATTVISGLVGAVATVVQAVAAASAVAAVFLQHKSLNQVLTQLFTFACAWTVRAISLTAQEAWARIYGLRAVAELRASIAKGYAASAKETAGSLTLLTRGIDAVELYVTKYLPQLILAVLVPLGLLGYIAGRDLWTAIIIVVTIPLIPAFMALIGWFTEDSVTRQWQAVGRITGVINDLFAGLPDLIVFDRARAQSETIRRLGTHASQATMKVLRISFLSAFVLELLATISVALVAVGIGLRLTNGQLDLETGLAVLILAPDVYLPIRMVGTQFHAAVEGMTAWAEARPLIEVHQQRTSSLHASINSVRLQDVVLGYGQPLGIPITFVSAPGTLTVITGASGAGKTTLLRTIAGLQPVLGGTVQANGVDVHLIDESEWFRRVGYLTQDPWLGHGTVQAALTRGSTSTIDECVEALGEVGLDDSLLQSRIDDLGGGISVGQRRRIAMARVLLRKPDVLLLDEPTAAVDAESEASILDALLTARARGTIIIAVAHRPALVAASDQIVHVVPE